ncbi:hypothetical protein [Helicobacter typhlonius]|uniref:hypothetical protein n=1 Tax=Helicobacter typhlonius TaxID=76936 RepID=UPI002FE31485
MKSRLYIPEKKLQKEFLPSDYFDSPSMNETNQKKPKIKKVNLSFLINKHQKEKDSEKEQNNEQKAENVNGQDTKDQIKATQSTKIETDSNTKSTNNKTETSETKTPTNNKTETPETKTTTDKAETPETKTTNNKTETPETKTTTDMIIVKTKRRNNETRR